MKIGQIVYSKAGRDKGKALIIISSSDLGVFVVDGKERPLERPKLKNIKHLEFTDFCLSDNEYRSNKALKAALKRYQAKRDEL